MSKVWKTAVFWEDLAERAMSTGIQALVAAFGVDQVFSTSADWRYLLSMAGSAALLSALKSLLAGLKGDPDSASLVK